MEGLVDLVGVDVLVDVAKCRVVGIAPSRAATGREAALVDLVSLDVTRRVVAGEETSFVLIGVSGESTTDSGRPIVCHLCEMSDVMTVSCEIFKFRNFYKKFINSHVVSAAVVDCRLIGQLVFVEPDKH